MSEIKERQVKSVSGIPLLTVLLLLTVAAVFAFINLDMSKAMRIATIVITVRTPGLRFNNPFYSKKKISLRVRNFESGKLKVNELEGSPIEIAAIVVWEVNDSAEAVFNVDSYESFVQIQSEAATPTQ